jgi:hypothetical protein
MLLTSAAVFPVTFGSEAVTVGHKTLNGKSGELTKTMQILKCCGKSFEIPLFEEIPMPSSIRAASFTAVN